MISIVIPAYNAAATVGRCLDSLLAQTYRDFELIVVDDGSTDSTAQIISAYAERDSRIRLIGQENAGVSAARNVGLDAARGDLIGFTDSDDAISPEFLEALLSLYAPGVLPVADIERSDGDGSVLASLPPAITLDPTRLPEDYFCGTLGQGIAFSSCNKLFSATLLRDACLRFAEKLTVGEDMLFVFRYLRRCREVRLTRRAVYRYNIAKNSAMQSRRDYTGAYEPITEPNYTCSARRYRLFITMYPTDRYEFNNNTLYWLNGDLLGETAGDMKIEQLKDKGVRIQLNFGVGRYDDAHTISTVKYTNMPSTYGIGDKVADFTPGTLKGVGEYFWYIAKLDSNEDVVGMYVAKDQEATMLKAMPDLTSSDIADARKSFGTTFESDYYYALYNYQIIPVEYQFAMYVTVNVTYRNGKTASITFEGQGYDEESQPLAVSTSFVAVGLNPVPALKITTSAGHPKLSWNTVPGAAKYWIYRSTDGKNFKYYDSTKSTGYTNNSTNIGTTYYYKIKAVDSSGTTTDYSAVKSIKCTPAAPSLSISRVNGKPKLSWKAVSGATKYWIYRSTDGKNFKYYDLSLIHI